MKQRTIYRATEAQLKRCMLAHADEELRENLMMSDPEDVKDTRMLTFGGCTTGELREYLETLGVYQVFNIPDGGELETHPNDVIVWDAAKIHLLDAIDDLVYAEYDHPNMPLSNSPIWDVFGLSGDDDVDYNGSYLHILRKMLTLYQKHHKPTGCEF